MHIPDGYLGPVTYGGLWGAMVPLWSLAARKVQKAVRTKDVPYLAMGTVFSLVAMLFVLPLPGGTTGHITGTPLIAILLGPWAATISVSIALAIQALLLGDGGVTTLAANCLNIAFVESVVGSSVFRLIVWVGKSPTRRSLRAVAGAAAAYCAVNAGALLASLELGLQPWIYRDTPGASYFPFPFAVSVPAVMLPHLTAVGALEAAVTAMVLLTLYGSEVSMTRIGKTVFLLAAVAIGTFILPGSVMAHDYWIERSGEGFLLVYGHGNERLEYDRSSVSQIAAFDKEGSPVAYTTERREKELLIEPGAEAALLTAELDSGYWSRTIYGLKNLPKRKASRVVEAFRSVTYTMSLVAWGPVAQRGVEGVRLVVVPAKSPFELGPGDSLPIKVLLDGKPLEGVEIDRDHEALGTTDYGGEAVIPLTAGRQLLTVEWKEPLEGDLDADFLTMTATLTFEVNQ